jgi:hypothetical protein
MVVITNGDFETGDLTGWTDLGSGSGAYTETSTVTTGSKHGGTYGCRLYGNAIDGGRAWAWIKQVIPGNFAAISFWYKINQIDSNNVYSEFLVWIDFAGDTQYVEVLDRYTGSNPPAVGDWVQVNINREDLYTSGNDWTETVTLNVYTKVDAPVSGTSVIEVFIDDIDPNGYTLEEGVDNSAIFTGAAASFDMVNVDTYFEPSASMAIILDSIESLIISASVSRSLTDKMFSASFQFDKTSISAIPANYFTHVVFSIPDYTGASNVVFCGFFPSSRSQYRPADFKDAFTAVDYGFYPTKQYLSDDLLALRTPTFQSTYQKYRLNYDYCTDPLLNFHPGDVVVGGTTGDMGRVFENHFSGYLGQGYLILVDIVGSTHTVEPFFHDDEDLNVNGVTIAAADGYTMNVTGTPIVIHPDDWVRNVLGGDNWAKVTGIEPYRITAVSAWDAALPAVEFIFEETQSKLSAIEEIAEYCSYIFLIKWRSIGGGLYRPCAYFVPESDIDNGSVGLDLPTAVTFTVSTDSTIIDITLDRKGEERYNKVTVRCKSVTSSTWYTSVKQTDGCASGEDKPIEFYEVNKDICTQAEADTRATDIYNYYSSNVETWTVTLKARSDLQFLQKATFSGYGTSYQLPNGDYRIVSIKHNYAPKGSAVTTIQIVDNTDFTAHLKLNRVFTGAISTVRAVAKNVLALERKNRTGTIVAVNGDGTLQFQDDRGNITTVGDPS